MIDYNAERERHAAELRQYNALVEAVKIAASNYARRTGSQLNRTYTTYVDLAADAYIIMQESPNQTDDTPDSKIRRAAYEAVRRAIRAQKKHTHYLDLDDIDAPEPDTMVDAIAIRDAIDRGGELVQMLSYGYTITEISQHIGAAPSTTWRRIEQARGRTKKYLENAK